MDVLSIIQSKAATLKPGDEPTGIAAVVHHIEVAEDHFHRARGQHEGDLFTDVVYRTNHAFEGILKEAYAVFTGDNPENKNPYEIEEYLESQEIFLPRVRELFRNYRTQWRNPSTHDYQLVFTEQEAFLSVVSVSSFISILLDQMIQRKAFDAEQAEAARQSDVFEHLVKESEGLPLLDKAALLIRAFSKDLQRQMKPSEELNEVQVLGMLRGFIDSVAPSISQHPEFQFRGSQMRGDLRFDENSEQVVIEMKRAGGARAVKTGINQLSLYLAFRESKQGILYLYPTSPEATMATERRQMT